jgi:hypothetical protein
MGSKGSSLAKKGCNCGSGGAAASQASVVQIPPPVVFSSTPQKEVENFKDLPASEIFGLAFQRTNEKRGLHGVPPVDLILGATTEEAFSDAAAIAEAFKQNGCKQLTYSAKAVSGLVAQNIYAITLGGMTYDANTLIDLLAVAVDIWYEGGPETPEFRRLIWKDSQQVSYGLAVADCGDGRSPWLIFIANFTPAGNV